MAEAGSFDFLATTSEALTCFFFLRVLGEVAKALHLGSALANGVLNFHKLDLIVDPHPCRSSLAGPIGDCIAQVPLLG